MLTQGIHLVQIDQVTPVMSFAQHHVLYMDSFISKAHTTGYSLLLWFLTSYPLYMFRAT